MFLNKELIPDQSEGFEMFSISNHAEIEPAVWDHLYFFEQNSAWGNLRVFKKLVSDHLKIKPAV